MHKWKIDSIYVRCAVKDPNRWNLFFYFFVKTVLFLTSARKRKWAWKRLLAASKTYIYLHFALFLPPFSLLSLLPFSSSTLSLRLRIQIHLRRGSKLCSVLYRKCCTYFPDFETFGDYNKPCSSLLRLLASTQAMKSCTHLAR